MSLQRIQLHVIDSWEEACKFISWAATRDAQGSVGVDTETTGLNRQTDRPRTIQVGGREHGWCIPVEGPNGFTGIFSEFVRSYTGQYIMHNAVIDRLMLEKIGIRLPKHRIGDTRVMSHILEPDKHTALKEQAARHVDKGAAEASHRLDKALGTGEDGYTWATIPLDFGPYWQYAGLDTILTIHLYDHHWPLVQGEAPKSYDLEMAAQWITAAMTVKGARVDVPYARKAKDELAEIVTSLRYEIESDYDFSPGSNKKIIAYLQSDGINFEKKTKGGALSLDAEVLASIDHPLANQVLRYRKAQKLVSTYLEHFCTETDADSRIHPTINNLGARTGRMSMSKPNMQNLPRVSEGDSDSLYVRNSIVSSPGHTLVLCDFSQIEMRILASYSKCAQMINAFKSPEDFFVTLAQQIFKDSAIDKGDSRRRLVKNGCYARIYGAGPGKFARTARVTAQASHDFFSRFNLYYPEVDKFVRAIESTAWKRFRSEKQAYARSLITRRRFVADPGRIYALLNYLIQGCAAEILKLKLVELDAIGLGKYMILPVHDEIIMDVPDDEVSSVIDSLHDIMHDDSILDVPITATVATGRRWGTKSEIAW